VHSTRFLQAEEAVAPGVQMTPSSKVVGKGGDLDMVVVDSCAIAGRRLSSFEKIAFI